MTEHSPLPPSPRSPRGGANIRAVMFGESWTDPNGEEHIAEEPLVLLEFLIDGNPAAVHIQTPESAIAVARLLVDAAGRCFHSDVDDTGKPIPAMERLTRFNQAWGGK